MPTPFAASFHSVDDLARSIHSATSRQVQGLQIELTEDAVTVSGSSRTYYVKQLATQAILNLAPTLRLQNEIRVCVN